MNESLKTLVAMLGSIGMLLLFAVLGQKDILVNFTVISFGMVVWDAVITVMVDNMVVPYVDSEGNINGPISTFGKILHKIFYR